MLYKYMLSREIKLEGCKKLRFVKEKFPDVSHFGLQVCIQSEGE